MNRCLQSLRAEESRCAKRVGDQLAWPGCGSGGIHVGSARERARAEGTSVEMIRLLPWGGIRPPRESPTPERSTRSRRSLGTAPAPLRQRLKPKWRWRPWSRHLAWSDPLKRRSGLEKGFRKLRSSADSPPGLGSPESRHQANRKATFTLFLAPGWGNRATGAPGRVTSQALLHGRNCRLQSW